LNSPPNALSAELFHLHLLYWLGTWFGPNWSSWY